jgi:hypothetical protein
MKKIAMLALLACSQAHSADWKIASVGDKYANFIDTSSITKVGPYRKAWLLQENAEPRFTETQVPASYLSSMFLVYYDCAQKTFEMVQFLHYSAASGSGKIVDSESTGFSPSKLVDVVPGSVGESNLKAVCAAQIK